jgi:hypothetical protein
MGINPQLIALASQEIMHFCFTHHDHAIVLGSQQAEPATPMMVGLPSPSSLMRPP